MATSGNQSINDPFGEMDRLAQSLLGLEKWGFRESTRFKAISPQIIYDSQFCRVNLIWDGWEMNIGYSMSILYGRLHAPNNEIAMIWNDESCRCWHRVEHALHFLDKLAPKEAAKANYSHPLIDQFYEQDYIRRFRYRQPEWLIQMHAVIWEHYGQRLFELFDLRHPQLWEKYRQFLKEFYDIKGRSPAIKPALDKVC